MSSLSFKRFMQKLCNYDNACDRTQLIALPHALAEAHNPALGIPDPFRFLGNCPTYLSPNSTLSFASHLGQNVGLGEG